MPVIVSYVRPLFTDAILKGSRVEGCFCVEGRIIYFYSVSAEVIIGRKVFARLVGNLMILSGVILFVLN